MNEIRSDMSEQYPWVKFYEAVATKLLEYKSREKRRELVQIMAGIADEIGYPGCKNLFSLRPDFGENKDKTKPLVVSDDVSPYTIFFFMNCNVSNETRIKIITIIGERLGIANAIERPISFEALPRLQLQKPGNLRWDSGKDWFKSQKESEQKDKIWKQYELAIQYADGDVSVLGELKVKFDEVKSMTGVGNGLTKGMYFIRPKSYMTMDNNSRKYIRDNMGIKTPKGKFTADAYFEVLDEMRQKFNSSDFDVHSFIDVSHVAYVGENDTDEESGTENGNMALAMKYAKYLKHCRNLILTGAPGTGKTYLARQIAKAMNADLGLSEDELKKFISFAQFHPSYDYVDFVEGLRPFKSESGEQVIFERQDGIFKEFCKRAIEKPYILASDEVDNFDDAWENLKSKTEENDDNVLSMKTLKGKELNIRPYRYYSDGFAGLVYKDNEWVLRTGMFFNKEQCYNVYRGQIGCKSRALDNYRKAIVQFMKDECGLKEYQAGTVNARKQINYVFIIDEINRGDLSKIFGELFFALDPGYRGKDKGRVRTQYQKLVDCEDDEFSGDGFYVPENVYIIGTMNDIDRSVESMDFALRRRFAWRKIRPEDTASEMGLSADARERMDAVNRVIRAIPELGEDYQLGGAYFLKMNDDADALSAEELWKYHLESLIDEYLRGLPDAREKKDRIKSAYDLRDDVTDEDMSEDAEA